MFGINKLREGVGSIERDNRELRRRLWIVENPPKFKKGDTVDCLDRSMIVAEAVTVLREEVLRDSYGKLYREYSVLSKSLDDFKWGENRMARCAPPAKTMTTAEAMAIASTPTQQHIPTSAPEKPVVRESTKESDKTDPSLSFYITLTDEQARQINKHCGKGTHGVVSSKISGSMGGATGMNINGEIVAPRHELKLTFTKAD